MSFIQLAVSAFEHYEANIVLDAAGIVLEIILMVSVLNEISAGNTGARKFLHVIVSVIASLATNMLPCLTMYYPELNGNTRWLISINGWAVCFYLYYISSYLISELKKKAFVYEGVYDTFAILCGAASIIWTVGNIMTDSWFFIEDETGHLHATPLSNLRFVFIVGLYLFCTMLLLSCRRTVQQKELNYWLLCLLLPVVLLFLPYSKVYIYHFGIAASTLCLYIGIDIERFHSIAINEQKLTEMKTRLLISQIQPHFMYNSLNSIYYLIGVDQEKAQEALSVFSDYLRRNVNALKSEELVNIKFEMEHVGAYLYLEKIRFGNKIKIVYDQQEMDFKVPSLSVQPLVENAIKHGLSKKKGGGTLTIATSKDDVNYYVTIEDDGVGFDPKHPTESGGTHTGVYNVADRIKTMCSGTLKITSEPGKGTKCVISIPKETQKN